MLLLGATQLLVAPAAAFSPSPPPERRSETVEAECFGRTISFTVDTDRLGISRLRAVSYDGRIVVNRSTARFGSLVTELAGANVGSVHCISDTEVALAISGSRRNTPPGQEDDVIEWIAISLSDEGEP